MNLNLHTGKRGTVKPKGKGKATIFYVIPHDSNSNDKLGIDSTLILPPLSIGAPLSEGI